MIIKHRETESDRLIVETMRYSVYGFDSPRDPYVVLNDVCSELKTGSTTIRFKSRGDYFRFVRDLKNQTLKGQEEDVDDLIGDLVERSKVEWKGGD